MTEPLNDFAWPADWRTDPGYQRTYRALLFNYGPEHATKVTLGLDHESNRDLWLWRRLGGGASSPPVKGSTP